MQVTKHRVVQLHYTLKNDRGEVLDSSADADAFAYLHGAGQIIPGLEEALEGHTSGERLSVTLPPERGYGRRDEALVQTVPRSAFNGASAVRPGMRFSAQSERGPLSVTVTQVEGDQVTVDGNYPLAGETLHFEVEIGDVRDATAEEVTHGHAHGPDGHGHK